MLKSASKTNSVASWRNNKIIYHEFRLIWIATLVTVPMYSDLVVTNEINIR